MRWITQSREDLSYKHSEKQYNKILDLKIRLSLFEVVVLFLCLKNKRDLSLKDAQMIGTDRG